MLANKKRRTILAAAILVVLYLIISPACGSQTKTTQSSTGQKATVTRGNISNEITATGNLSMPNQAKLTFGASGTVDEISVKIGDSVTSGQVLSKLDAVTVSTLKQNLLQAQINVKQAQMNLDNASTPTLSSSGTTVTAPDPLDVEAKQLALQSARLNLDNAQRQLDGSALIAPFDGQVAAVNVLVGDRVSTGTAAIRLIDPAQLQVDTLVNEMDIFNVAPGSKAAIQVTATNTNLDATVAAISPSATSSGGVVNYTVQLKVTPAKSSSQDATTGNNTTDSGVYMLKEGLSVSISLIIQQKQNVLIVLSRALSRQGGNTIANVLNSNGTTEQRTVKTGITDWQNTEITSGLNEGEILLISTASSSSTTTGSNIGAAMGGGPPGGGGGPPP